MAEFISVIIPAYNAEKYIERCIRSVQNQTYQNIEIIVVNDGSADGTEEICRKCGSQDARIRVLSQENRGVSAARNRGMEEAKGEYFSFVDADDTLPPAALAVLLEKLAAEKADIASGGMRAIHNDGTVKEESASSGIWTGQKALEMSLRDNTHTYSVWGKLFKKEFVGRVRFEEKRSIHEDSFFLFQCFEKEPRMVCLPSCVYDYYILPNSASRADFSEKYHDILYFAEQKYKIVQKSYPQYERLAQNMLVKANMAFLKISSRTRSSAARAQERVCIQQVKAKKQYFIPATETDKKWFLIIRCNLYYLYKICYHEKRRLEAIRNKK